MKISKKAILLKGTVFTVSSIIMSGCFGGAPAVKAPVTDREQSLNPVVMKKITNKYEKGASKSFTEKTKSGKTVLIEKASLSKIKKAKELKKLMMPLIAEASKIFKARGLSKEIMMAAPKFLQDDPESVQITLYSFSNKLGNKSFNASYTPFNDIYIQNLDLSTKEGKARAQFVLAHELGHAVAMHVTEDETSVQEALDGGADIANLALDIATNELYGKLNDTQKKIVDKEAILLAPKLNIDKKDYDNDDKLETTRKESFSGKIALNSNNPKLMHIAGFGFEIPKTSRIVIKKMLFSGLDSSGIMDMINNSSEAVMQSAILVVHSKEQELEADKIAQKILSNLKIPVKETACTLFHSKKQAGLFDAHPSHQDRLANLSIKSCK